MLKKKAFILTFSFGKVQINFSNRSFNVKWSDLFTHNEQILDDEKVGVDRRSPLLDLIVRYLKGVNTR